jgi:formate dehydrogenase major subunit
MIFWGHAPNSQTRTLDMKKAMEKLDMLVVIDPHPTASAVLSERKNGTYLLSDQGLIIIYLNMFKQLFINA